MSLPGPTADPYRLQRFLDAQVSIFESARAELAAGRKQSHWMWFIFPQIRGLGSSPMAQRFAIADLGEGAAYLEHPVLGPRLRECTSLVNSLASRSASEIFGYPDDLKFRSSMTLFHQVSAAKRLAANGGEDVFAQALTKFFGDVQDQATLGRLKL